MSQSESRRVAHCMYVEIELKKKKKEKKKKRNVDFESLVLRKFRKITAISHPCNTETNITQKQVSHCVNKLWQKYNTKTIQSQC